eukprot:360503-Chlamydomonas_euryale.AAC.3
MVAQSALSASGGEQSSQVTLSALSRSCGPIEPEQSAAGRLHVTQPALNALKCFAHAIECAWAAFNALECADHVYRRPMCTAHVHRSCVPPICTAHVPHSCAPPMCADHLRLPCVPRPCVPPMCTAHLYRPHAHFRINAQILKDRSKWASGWLQMSDIPGHPGLLQPAISERSGDGRGGRPCRTCSQSGSVPCGECDASGIAVIDI